MTISSGKSTPIWAAGSVILILLAVFGARMFSGETSSAAPAVTTRDSAGVEVVESIRPAWDEGKGWRVGSNPELKLGVVDGDPVYQFSGITGLARLDDGTVVVADDGSQEVRFFDAEGTAEAVVGGRGGGPGEFTGLSGLGANPAGGVWAYDFSLRRVTWMNAMGEITHLSTLGNEPPVLNSMGALPDGSFVLKQLWGYSAVAGAQDPGLRRDPVAVVRFDSAGTLLDTLGLYPGREVYLFEEDGRGVMSTPPFAHNAVGTILGDGIVVGTQEDFSLLEYDTQGELRRIVRIPGRVSRVQAQDLQAYIQSRLEDAPPERQPSIRQSLQEMPHPETLPAYGGVLGDRSGNLWVAEWAMAPRLPSYWTVFDQAGQWLGDVTIPQGFLPWDIGEDWILGTERDELDVEYVVLYPLRKG